MRWKGGFIIIHYCCIILLMVLVLWKDDGDKMRKINISKILTTAIEYRIWAKIKLSQPFFQAKKINLSIF